jgi:hypothetical protein
MCKITDGIKMITTQVALMVGAGRGHVALASAITVAWLGNF